MCTIFSRGWKVFGLKYRLGGDNTIKCFEFNIPTTPTFQTYRPAILLRYFVPLDNVLRCVRARGFSFLGIPRYKRPGVAKHRRKIFFIFFLKFNTPYKL